MNTEKPASRWITKPFRFIFRLVTTVLLICYVLFGETTVTELYKRNTVRAQPASAFNTVIDDAVQKKDLQAVTAWMKARPLAETDQLVDVLLPKSPALEPATFFEVFNRQLKLGRIEEALFWLQLSRFRLRYDIIRCGAKPEDAKFYDMTFEQAHADETDNLLRAHPDLLRKSLRRVLDFDVKYPAHDDPAMVCRGINPRTKLPVEEINWEGYHQLIRKHTEDFINAPDKVKTPAQKKPAAEK